MNCMYGSEHLAKAAEIFQSMRSPVREAACLNNLAVALAKQGNWYRSLEIFRSALILIDSLEGALHKLQILGNYGIVHVSLFKTSDFTILYSHPFAILSGPCWKIYRSTLDPGTFTCNC